MFNATNSSSLENSTSILNNVTSVRTTSNWTPYHSERLFRLVCGIIFVIIGTFGNLLVATTIIKAKDLLRQSFWKIILSLTFCDLLYCVVQIPSEVLFELSNDWTRNFDLRTNICRTFAPVFFWTFFIAVFTFTVLFVHALLATAFESKNQWINKKSIVLTIIAFIWISSLALALLPYFELWGRYKLSSKPRSFCGIFKHKGKTPVDTFYFIGLLIPTLTMVLTCAIIWYKQSRINNGNTSLFQSFHVALFKMLIAIFVIFLIAYFPNLLTRFMANTRSTLVKHTMCVLVCLNAAIKPLIYFWCSKDLRIALKNLIGVKSND